MSCWSQRITTSSSWTKFAESLLRSNNISNRKLVQLQYPLKYGLWVLVVLPSTKLPEQLAVSIAAVQKNPKNASQDFHPHRMDAVNGPCHAVPEDQLEKMNLGPGLQKWTFPTHSLDCSPFFLTGVQGQSQDEASPVPATSSQLSWSTVHTDPVLGASHFVCLMLGLFVCF